MALKIQYIDRKETLHGGAKSVPITTVEPEGYEVNMGVGWYEVGVGKRCNLHVHQRKTEAWIVIQGEGRLTLGNDEIDIEKGFVIFTPPGVPHAVTNTGSEALVFVDVTYPRIGRDPVTGKPLDSRDLEAS